MALMQWDTRLETGRAEIDAQHIALVAALNRLHDAMLEGQGSAEVGRTLQFLVDYTAAHFHLEEALMDQCGYAGAGSHKRIHAGLGQQMQSLVERYQQNPATLTIAVMIFLEEWLTDHFLGEDRRLVECLGRS